MHFHASNLKSNSQTQTKYILKRTIFVQVLLKKKVLVKSEILKICYDTLLNRLPITRHA